MKKTVLLLTLATASSVASAQSSSTCTMRNYLAIQRNLIDERIMILDELRNNDRSDQQQMGYSKILKLQAEISEMRNCEESAFVNQNYAECLYAVPERYRSETDSCVDSK